MYKFSYYTDTLICNSEIYRSQLGGNYKAQKVSDIYLFIYLFIYYLFIYIPMGLFGFPYFIFSGLREYKTMLILNILICYF